MPRSHLAAENGDQVEYQSIWQNVGNGCDLRAVQFKRVNVHGNSQTSYGRPLVDSAHLGNGFDNSAAKLNGFSKSRSFDSRSRKSEFESRPETRRVGSGSGSVHGSAHDADFVPPQQTRDIEGKAVREWNGFGGVNHAPQKNTETWVEGKNRFGSGHTDEGGDDRSFSPRLRAGGTNPNFRRKNWTAGVSSGKGGFDRIQTSASAPNMEYSIPGRIVSVVRDELGIVVELTENEIVIWGQESGLSDKCLFRKSDEQSGDLYLGAWVNYWATIWESGPRGARRRSAVIKDGSVKMASSEPTCVVVDDATRQLRVCGVGRLCTIRNSTSGYLFCEAVGLVYVSCSLNTRAVGDSVQFEALFTPSNESNRYRSSWLASQLWRAGCETPCPSMKCCKVVVAYLRAKDRIGFLRTVPEGETVFVASIDFDKAQECGLLELRKPLYGYMVPEPELAKRGKCKLRISHLEEYKASHLEEYKVTQVVERKSLEKVQSESSQKFDSGYRAFEDMQWSPKHKPDEEVPMSNDLTSTFYGGVRNADVQLKELTMGKKCREGFIERLKNELDNVAPPVASIITSNLHGGAKSRSEVDAASSARTFSNENFTELVTATSTSEDFQIPNGGGRASGEDLSYARTIRSAEPYRRRSVSRSSSGRKSVASRLLSPELVEPHSKDEEAKSVGSKVDQAATSGKSTGRLSALEKLGQIVLSDENLKHLVSSRDQNLLKDLMAKVEK